jgi:hypothetical protein
MSIHDKKIAGIKNEKSEEKVGTVFSRKQRATTFFCQW